MRTWSYSTLREEVSGTARTTQLCRLYRSFVTITAGRDFRISCPTAGSRATSHISPRRGTGWRGIPSHSRESGILSHDSRSTARHSSWTRRDALRRPKMAALSLARSTASSTETTLSKGFPHNSRTAPPFSTGNERTKQRMRFDSRSRRMRFMIAILPAAPLRVNGIRAGPAVHPTTAATSRIATTRCLAGLMIIPLIKRAPERSRSRRPQPPRRFGVGPSDGWGDRRPLDRPSRRR